MKYEELQKKILADIKADIKSNEEYLIQENIKLEQ